LLADPGFILEPNLERLAEHVLRRKRGAKQDGEVS
jgi:hypothetical protein